LLGKKNSKTCMCIYF